MSAYDELLDVNVWIAFLHEGHPQHRRAQNIWPELNNPVFCRYTQMAFLRLLCNSRVMEENTHTLDQAWTKFDWLYANGFCDFVDEPEGLTTAFRYYAKSNRPAVQMLGDAYLASFALVGELRLFTFDAGFRQFKGLDCRIIDDP